MKVEKKVVGTVEKMVVSLVERWVELLVDSVGWLKVSQTALW